MEEKKEMHTEDQLEQAGGGAGGPYNFDGVHCPRCRSTKIHFTSFIAEGELAAYYCPDCHFHHEEFA